MKLFRALGFSVLLVLGVTTPAFASQTGSLLPASDGTYHQWTPSTGTSHFALVDESSCNGTTDYNSTTTVSNRDSYGISLTTVPDGATITQIDLTPCASRNATGATNPVMNVFYRLNGVDSSDAGNYSLTGTTPSVLAVTSFTGLSTVKSPSSTLEAGAVLTSGTKGARLSQLAAKITYTPLATPSGLSVVSTGSGTITVSWVDNATNESGFRVERADNGGAFVEIGSTSANVVTYNDTSLSEGTYAYRVRAYNSGGNSSYTSTVTAYVLNAPSSLGAVTASPSAVNLTWTDNASLEDGYLIERRQAGVGSFVQIKSVGPNATSTQDTSNPGFKTFEYRVRAFKNTNRSDYSNTATTTILLAPFRLIATPSATDAGSIVLNWGYSGSSEDGFKIERSDNVGGPFSEIATVGIVRSYVDPGLTSGNTYYYRIRAYKGLDLSDYSASASAIAP